MATSYKNSSFVEVFTLKVPYGFRSTRSEKNSEMVVEPSITCDIYIRYNNTYPTGKLGATIRHGDQWLELWALEKFLEAVDIIKDIGHGEVSLYDEELKWEWRDRNVYIFDQYIELHSVKYLCNMARHALEMTRTKMENGMVNRIIGLPLVNKEEQT